MHGRIFYWLLSKIAGLIELWVGNLQKMAESKPAMRKPEFTKVNQLRPGTSGHTLTVKVVSSKTVLQKGRAAGSQVRQMRLAECLVGDETGMIVFTARNEQGRCSYIMCMYECMFYGPVSSLCG